MVVFQTRSYVRSGPGEQSRLAHLPMHRHLLHQLHHLLILDHPSPPQSLSKSRADRTSGHGAAWGVLIVVDGEK